MDDENFLFTQFFFVYFDRFLPQFNSFDNKKRKREFENLAESNKKVKHNDFLFILVDERITRANQYFSIFLERERKKILSLICHHSILIDNQSFWDFIFYHTTFVSLWSWISFPLLISKKREKSKNREFENVSDLVEKRDDSKVTGNKNFLINLFILSLVV